ncbi:MAG: hypothetical protein ACOYBQ_10325 [Fluviibacter sp.]
MSRYIVRVSVAEQNRCSDAFGKKMGLVDSATGLPRPATDIEVLQQIGQFLIEVVEKQELKTALDAARASVVPITPDFPVA